MDEQLIKDTIKQQYELAKYFFEMCVDENKAEMITYYNGRMFALAILYKELFRESID
jgi:hypothetical protein